MTSILMFSSPVAIVMYNGHALLCNGHAVPVLDEAYAQIDGKPLTSDNVWSVAKVAI